MRVLLVGANAAQIDELRAALRMSDDRVVAHVTRSRELAPQVRRSAPEVILLAFDELDAATLDHLSAVNRESARPMVVFTAQRDRETMRQALRAGVSVYVVDGLVRDRIRPLIDMAVMRFEEVQTLRRELADASERLAQRKLVERAKGIVMQTRGISEDQAYRALRRMAMDRGQALRDIAETIVSAERLLAPR